MIVKRWLACVGIVLSVSLPGTAGAITELRVDAAATPSPLTQGFLHMGSATAPNGETLTINSRYLELNGKPWLPVMGEFHYARVPEREWATQLQKMKSAGVEIVSTYIFWNYHEPQAGHFDWQGDRDLHRFVQLCADIGLKVVVRVGPWAHGEVRFGGIPDWVVQAMPTRRDDPIYLHYADRFYQQIASQLKGLWWKDGGPVIGVQIENEYNLDGPGQGAAHIATLKNLARAAGMDVPLYTVTGWDSTVFPLHDVIPVFGGYPDEPWSTSTTLLPPNETYMFRFGTRVSGADLGAQTHGNSKGDADASTPHTPFLGAEFGGGVPAMYRRRSVIAPDDIASMLPVELGSGVNLYGYYMFQGGRNLLGPTTLQESTQIGGYNDTPIVSYDFQAPLGQYGQEQPVLGAIRPFHYFLQAFGARLAPMTVHAPAIQPHSSTDLSTPRFSVRSEGESGFVFFNNYVRQYRMPAHPQAQFTVRLPHSELSFPHQPIDIPSGAFFIWPFHFDLDGIDLVYASAQPMTRLQNGDEVTYVFVATDGIEPEFAFAAGTAISTHQGNLDRSADRITVSGLHPSLAPAIALRTTDGRSLKVLILSRAQATQAWLRQVGERQQLVLTPDALYFDGATMRLSSTDDPHFELALYPAPVHIPNANLPLQRMPDQGAFAVYHAQAKPRALDVTVRPLRDASPVAPVRLGGSAHAAMEPTPETFAASAAWTITLPSHALDGLRDAYLDIRYQGDVGRLFADTTLLDDNYDDGRNWPVGLRRFDDKLDQPWTLTILPLRSDAPIYRQLPLPPATAGASQSAALESVQLHPVYGLDIGPDQCGSP